MAGVRAARMRRHRPSLCSCRRGSGCIPFRCTQARRVSQHDVRTLAWDHYPRER